MEQNVIVDRVSESEHEVLILEPPIRARAHVLPDGRVLAGQFWAPCSSRPQVEAHVLLAMADFISERAFGWTDVAEFIPAERLWFLSAR
ncbi:hypothetical protein GQF56_25435 [Rhodobacter sphaeroides]|uniref:hypothetical protein n=1 Tax=Cereibacter sphaeroides TaxID=1063 RepID=UPI0003752C76|nr:hypothetical protein [Cereibacter sphaeroides]AMJ49838.1 hypothetical protein APX01_19990 [Cereibacter sphaeroides]ANS36469.1 hypothetical protein A3858_19545 [Cereibacter sphaeroides]ATN65615.1 hypothetical protein A3857_20025 [Cereibacter sphaeroides]AXC64092.1 hypothetical protein DQL45_22180 [Cereibacter sphaeroides 2.4.1]MVX51141.1 hypothetical protein [Cereibacter sphaeroides]